MTNQPEEAQGPGGDHLHDISIDAMTEAFANVEMSVASKKRASV